MDVNSFITGHSDYSPYTFDTEYKRDLGKGCLLKCLQIHYKDDNPDNAPVVRWRDMPICCFLIGWTIIISETLFDINQIRWPTTKIELLFLLKKSGVRYCSCLITVLMPFRALLPVSGARCGWGIHWRISLSWCGTLMYIMSVSMWRWIRFWRMRNWRIRKNDLGLYRYPRDALIVQDMGLLELNLPPDIPLHASHPWIIVLYQKVRFWLRQVSVRWYWRELSLVEIGNIIMLVLMCLWSGICMVLLCVFIVDNVMLVRLVLDVKPINVPRILSCLLLIWDADGKSIWEISILLSLKRIRRRVGAIAGCRDFFLKNEGRLKGCILR